MRAAGPRGSHGDVLHPAMRSRSLERERRSSGMSLATCQRKWLIGAGVPKGLRAAAMLGLALACGACTGRPLQGVLVPLAESAEGTSRIPVLVATTRQRAVEESGDMFSRERAADMSYARLAVSIPPDSARK